MAELPDECLCVGGRRCGPEVGDEHEEDDQADHDHEELLQGVVAGLERLLQLGQVSHLQEQTHQMKQDSTYYNFLDYWDAETWKRPKPGNLYIVTMLFYSYI